MHHKLQSADETLHLENDKEERREEPLGLIDAKHKHVTSGKPTKEISMHWTDGIKVGQGIRWPIQFSREKGVLPHSLEIISLLFSYFPLDYKL